MTEDDLKELLEACKPTVCIRVGNYSPPGPQENANRAWQALGKKYGFDYMTVQPIRGKGERFFSAVPSETDVQKDERLQREAHEKRKAKIAEINEKIAALQRELKAMKEGGE